MTDSRESPAAADIDWLWDRILTYATHGMTLPEGENRDLATLILHFHRLQAEGWPTPSAWIQPIPETVDVPITNDLL